MKIVTFKWEPDHGYRSKFTAEHVNRLHKMIGKHYPHDYQLICVTDRPEGIDRAVKTYPLWDVFGDLPAPQGNRNPSCYRRLPMFDNEARRVTGADRFVMMDLDVVLTGDPSPAWHRKEDFVIWGGTNPKNPYNGSMILMDVGARNQVYRDFDPVNSPRVAKQAGHFGSDQAWISYKLGKREARFSQKDGVYSFRNDFQLANRSDLPDNASIVFFHGHVDPWDRQAQEFSWVREHWNI